MTVLGQIGATALQIGCAAFITDAMVPPNNVPRQLACAAAWFLAGVFITLTWNRS